MKTVGVIVEYNPLHNGHVYHFEQSRRAAGADAVVAVMSGHFLQRGEPAVAGKWARAEMALRMGADVVIELPVAYSSHAAEWFAFGAVSLLDATGVVDSVCFGSESGDIAKLSAAAQLVWREDDAFRALVRRELAGGGNYPAAYSAAAERTLAAAGIGGIDMRQPNNTLGLFYLIALLRLGSTIEPLTIARTKAGYNDQTITDRRIASATALRGLIFGDTPGSGQLQNIAPYVPPYTLSILQREAQAGRAPISWANYSRPLLHRLLAEPVAELAQYAEVTEGLEHRIKRALSELRLAEGEAAAEALLQLLKTKRYTRTKLQRTLLRLLLGHRKDELAPELLRGGAAYLRVLGFSPQGRQLLARMRTAAKVPVVTKVANADWPYLAMDIRATSAYALGFARCDSRELFRDYYEPPIQWPEEARIST
ncbi:MAG: nucleotidyltransferase [Paenibacillaceae bacterium]|nr:nucleotidyltransferase [Paenibacillaceae bacterium]